MKYNEFPDLNTLTENDVLLVQEASTLAIKKIKASVLKQYIGVGSTPPTTTISPIAGYAKWYRSDSITLSGNQLTAFTDKSPSANNLVAISTKPTLISNAINSRDAVLFNTSPMVTQPESYAAKTIYVVFKNNNATFSNYNAYVCYRPNSSNLTPISNELNIVSGSISKNNIYGEQATNGYLDNTSIYSNNYTNYDIGVPIGTVGQYHLIENINANSSVGVKNLCVGADSFAYDRCLINTEVAEIIIYPFVFTPEQRAAMNNYFKQMYNFSFL